jgi:pSer/pThr/pTyr-binding forkhead associated (FHA) protein
VPRLNIRQDNVPETTVELVPGGSARIGRAADNEVVLDDPRSSRVHAIVSQSGSDWIVTDMDSRNGTRLNGKPVHEAVLRGGDRIEIGRAVVEFQAAAEPATQRSRGGEARSSSSTRRAAGSFRDEEFERRPEAPVQPARSGAQRTVVLVAIVVIALGLVLVVGSQRNSGPPPPIPLPSGDAVGCIPNGDLSHSVSAVFVYTPPAELPKALELRYKAFDIDTDDEVRVYLNSQPFLALQPTGDGVWSSTRTFEIPLELLKLNEKNYLVFQHSFNKPDDSRPFAWGVSDVQIAPVVELPCTPDQAESEFKLASKQYEDRRVLASNLFNAIQKLDRAFALTKACIPKPAFYTEVTTLRQTAKRELDDAYKFCQVEFTKARRLGRIEDCLSYVARIQQLIPDREDPRYLQALRWKRSLPIDTSKKREDPLY